MNSVRIMIYHDKPVLTKGIVAGLRLAGDDITEAVDDNEEVPANYSGIDSELIEPVRLKIPEIEISLMLI